MRFRYNRKFKGDITKDNVEEVTKISPHRWRNLSGMFSKNLPAGFANKKNFTISGTSQVIFVVGSNDNFSITMRCDLESKTLFISNVKITNKNNGWGLVALKTHIQMAANLGFKKIKCVASAKVSVDGKEKNNGYITWAKFGFIMDKESRNEFLKKMEDDQKIYKDLRTKNCLQKLIYFPKGLEHWIETGKSWQNLEAYPTHLEIKQGVLKHDRKYFFNNIQHGITTFQDQYVINLIVSEVQK